MIHTNKSEYKINNFVKWVIGIPYYLWATYFSLSMLHDLVWFIIGNFSSYWHNVIAHPVLILFILIIVPVTVYIGWFIFGLPLYALWYGFVFAINLGEQYDNLWKRYSSFILVSIGGMLVPLVWLYLFTLILIW